MATINPEILESAMQDGVFDSQPKAYYHKSVNAAIEVMAAIRGSGDGMDYGQLGEITHLHLNTVKQYCRWLEKAGLIRKETIEGLAVWFADRNSRAVETKKRHAKH